MIKPINDKILVKPAEAPKSTLGGILLPDTAQKKGQRGTVLAVGNGKEHINPAMYIEGGLGVTRFERTKFTVKEGDTVLFPNYAGHEIEEEGHKYLILTEDDILAVLQ